jgi:hypothetical protein
LKLNVQRIFRILLSDEFMNENLIINTIACMETITKSCWPRMSKIRCDEILLKFKEFDFNSKNQNEILKLELLFKELKI